MAILEPHFCAACSQQVVTRSIPSGDYTIRVCSQLPLISSPLVLTPMGSLVLFTAHLCPPSVLVLQYGKHYALLKRSSGLSSIASQPYRLSERGHGRMRWQYAPKKVLNPSGWHVKISAQFNNVCSPTGADLRWQKGKQPIIDHQDLQIA